MIRRKPKALRERDKPIESNALNFKSRAGHSATRVLKDGRDEPVVACREFADHPSLPHFVLADY
jgi:hypothetical protein